MYTMKLLKKELLNLKGSKLGQILRADKTGFRRLSHIPCFLISSLFFGLQTPLLCSVMIISEISINSMISRIIMISQIASGVSILQLLSVSMYV